MNHADIVFIAVATPQGDDGNADLQYVNKVVSEIGHCIDKNILLVNRSTCPVGTAESIGKQIREILHKRNINFDIEVAVNPEFLREGKAVGDFESHRAVVGCTTQKSFELLKQLYQRIGDDFPIIQTSLQGVSHKVCF